MRRYLLDTTPLTAYLKGISTARSLIEPWITRQEAATRVLVYGKMTEYNLGFSDFARHHNELRLLLDEIVPYVPTYSILERYADLRRPLRPPRGPGLIGDIDTLIASTALEYDLRFVTTDTDFQHSFRLCPMDGTRKHLNAATGGQLRAGPNP